MRLGNVVIYLYKAVDTLGIDSETLQNLEQTFFWLEKLQTYYFSFVTEI